MSRLERRLQVQELLLKEALIEKNGNKCHFCDKSNVHLSIEYLLGQKELEIQYFDKYERITGSITDYDRLLHTFYLHNFDEESKYIGLVCENWKVSQKEIPRLEDVLPLVNDFLHKGDHSEYELMMSKHSQIMPIVDRRLRLMQQLALEEIQSGQLDMSNQRDNSGRENV